MNGLETIKRLNAIAEANARLREQANGVLLGTPRTAAKLRSIATRVATLAAKVEDSVLPDADRQFEACTLELAASLYEAAAEVALLAEEVEG